MYDSLSRTDEEGVRVLDHVISIVLPSINPDGSQMIADWYMKHAGTEYEAAGLPWLYQKYAGLCGRAWGGVSDSGSSVNLGGGRPRL